jgi:outer membrane protein TolC
MSRAQICALLLSISLSLTGCANYSGIHGEAHALAPQLLAFDQNQGGGDWPREDWWTMFGDPKLDALMRQALQGNPSLRAAEARVRAAHALADAAGASLYPRLDVDASATRQRFSRNDIYPPPFGGSWVNQGRVALDFNYEFDFWGKHRAELEAASATPAQSRPTRRRLGSCSRPPSRRPTSRRRRILPSSPSRGGRLPTARDWSS